MTISAQKHIVHSRLLFFLFFSVITRYAWCLESRERVLLERTAVIEMSDEFKNIV